MAKEIKDLRETLFSTIEDLKSGKIDVDKAKAITGIAQVIVDSARAETEFLHSVNATASTGFIGGNVKEVKKIVGGTGAT